MTQISLRRRFFLHTAIALIGVMVISLLVVDYSYRSELTNSADQRLRLHIFNLLSIAEKADDSLRLPDILRNPSFNTLNSGQWAMVLDRNEKVIWRSLSLDRIPDILLPEHATGSWMLVKQNIDQQRFRIMSYRIAWETTDGLEHYRFVVAENENVVHQEVTRFRWWLGMGFLLITFCLLVGQHLVLRSSFRPIHDLEKEIAGLEKGEQRRLMRRYPQELRGVSDNLNALIHKEHEQREKYRASMADLAHSLKTPLAIVKGELQSAANRSEVLQKAIARIDQSIEYQLRRAVISGHSLLYQGTPVKEVLEDLIDVLNRAHRDNPVSVVTDIQEDLNFFGDENDLMEVLGNLLDNAFRYARSEIKVTASSRRRQLKLVIEDDGMGFTKQQAEQIFKRGERLDRQDFGQGIGLSVVYDIVNSYQGEITACRSDMGGACFILLFPSKTEDS